MFVSPALLKWGTFILAILSVVSASGQMFCRGSEEGFCDNFNTYWIWVGAACSLLTFLGIVLRESTTYSAAIRFGLPAVAFVATGLHWASAGTTFSDEPPVALSWANLALSALTLAILGYDTFRFGIGAGAYGAYGATGYGASGYGSAGYGTSGYETGYY